MAAQYVAIKRISSLDTPITAEKLDGSLFTTENQAHEFIISVRKNGVKQTVTGSVSGKFIRANGTTIFLQGSIVDGDAVVRLHQDCYNVQGRFTFNIFNTQSGVTTCIYSAVGKMDMGSTETVIDAGDVVPDVSDVVAAQEAAQAAITAANTAAQTANTAAQNVGSIVARPYSSSSTYTAGDYCTNNGNLYKANQDISTAEEWTASHWTQIVMGDEVTDLKSAIEDLNKNLIGSGLIWTYGKYIKDNGQIGDANSTAITDYIPVNGDLFLKYNAPMTVNGSEVYSYVSEYTEGKTFSVRTAIVSRSTMPYALQLRKDTAFIRFNYAVYTGTMTSAITDYFSVQVWKKTYDLYDEMIEGFSNIDSDIEYINEKLKHRITVESGDVGSIAPNSGSIVTPSSNMHTDYIPVKGIIGATIFSTPNPSVLSPGGAYYDENKNYISGIYAKQTDTSNYEYTRLNPPNDAVYARFTVRPYSETWGYFYYDVIEEYPIDDLYAQLDKDRAIVPPIGLHVMPDNQGVVNAIKRVRQMTDIKWTPDFDLDRAFIYTRDSYHWDYDSVATPYKGKFETGREYIGLPYNDPSGNYRALGIEIPIDVFATAVKNNRSVEALESLYTPFGASYYACTCTILTCYALDLPYITSTVYKIIPGMIKTGIDINFGMDKSFASRLKLCDILQINGHCAIITDIILDDSGNVQLIEISEESRQGNTNTDILTGKQGSVCRRYTVTVDEFITMFAGFTVLRYTRLDKVKYTPSVYSPVADEGNRYAPDFYPIMPYYGNFSSVDPGGIKLLINNSGYDTLIVKRDGVEISSIVVTGLDEVTVACNEEGKYTAYLASFNGNNEIIKGTLSCTWYVRPTIIPTYTVVNDSIEWQYRTKGVYIPYYVQFGTSMPIRIYDDDLTVVDNGDGTYTYSFVTPFSSSGSAHCKFVARSGERGAVVTEIIIE